MQKEKYHILVQSLFSLEDWIQGWFAVIQMEIILLLAKQKTAVKSRSIQGLKNNNHLHHVLQNDYERECFMKYILLMKIEYYLRIPPKSHRKFFFLLFLQGKKQGAD